MKIPSTVHSFADLVAYLIAKYHDGVAWDMASALGVSSGLVYQWRKGLIHRPSEPILHKLSDYYGLDPVAVLAITYNLGPIHGWWSAARTNYQPSWPKSSALVAGGKP